MTNFYHFFFFLISRTFRVITSVAWATVNAGWLVLANSVLFILWVELGTHSARPIGSTVIDKMSIFFTFYAFFGGWYIWCNCICIRAAIDFAGVFGGVKFDAYKFSGVSGRSSKDPPGHNNMFIFNFKLFKNFCVIAIGQVV